MLPDKINPPNGRAPSLLVAEGSTETVVKLCSFVKPVPLVLTANTVPLPEVPPRTAVPYKVLPDKINPPNGRAPSLLVAEGSTETVVKLCSVVKPVPLVLT